MSFLCFHSCFCRTRLLLSLPPNSCHHWFCSSSFILCLPCRHELGRPCWCFLLWQTPLWWRSLTHPPASRNSSSLTFFPPLSPRPLFSPSTCLSVHIPILFLFLLSLLHFPGTHFNRYLRDDFVLVLCFALRVGNCVVSYLVVCWVLHSFSSSFFVDTVRNTMATTGSVDRHATVSSAFECVAQPTLRSPLSPILL